MIKDTLLPSVQAPKNSRKVGAITLIGVIAAVGAVAYISQSSSLVSTTNTILAQKGSL